MSIVAKYKYPSVILTTNNFKDINGLSVPLIDLNGLQYQNCGSAKKSLFRSPFVFVLSEFWPELRVLDQQGYEIIKMEYPSKNCARDIGIDQIKDSTDCISFFCP